MNSKITKVPINLVILLFHIEGDKEKFLLGAPQGFRKTPTVRVNIIGLFWSINLSILLQKLVFVPN